MYPYFAATMIAMGVVSVGVPIAIFLVMLLLPGRKGTMRTERLLRLPETGLAAAHVLMVERLQGERFEIEGSTADMLRGIRRGKPLDHVHAHSDKTLRVEIRFVEDGGATVATIAIWIKDFIFHDTGESQLIDLQLQRLVEGPTDKPMAVVMNTSFTALTAVISSGLVFGTLAVLMADRSAPTSLRSDVLVGSLFSGLLLLIIALKARRVIQRRKDELRGVTLTTITIVLAILSLTGGASLIGGRYWPIVKQRVAEDFNREHALRD